MSRRGKTFEQRFLDELARQVDGGELAVNNKILREQLGWQDERFAKVRASLLGKGIIKAAQGHGGKTRFAENAAPKEKIKHLKAFISYSHVDEAIKDQFLRHLKPLEHLGLIKSWHDRMIKPGDSFNVSIANEIENSDIVFLLVSIDFINSKYCYDIELSRAIDLHSEGKIRIIPVIIRGCLWNHSPFGGLQALPKDAKPITSWSDRDEAMTSVAKAVHEIALELVAS